MMNEPEPDEIDALASLARFPTAVLYDAAMRLGLDGAVRGVRPLTMGLRIAGRALTARYAPKAETTRVLSLYDAIADAPAGSVLAIELGRDQWVAGGNITAFARRCGLAGMVIDGCIRDVAEIRASGFPIYCRGPAVDGYAPEWALQAINVPITCGGVRIEPNDHIVGDEDGVFVVPADSMSELTFQAADIAELDRRQAHGIEAGWPLEALRENMARWRVRKARAGTA